MCLHNIECYFLVAYSLRVVLLELCSCSTLSCYLVVPMPHIFFAKNFFRGTCPCFVFTAEFVCVTLCSKQLYASFQVNAAANGVVCALARYCTF